MLGKYGLETDWDRIRQTKLNESVKASRILTCARELRLWQLQNGISWNDEVGCNVEINQGFETPGQFVTGKNKVTILHTEKSVGSLHTHPNTEPQSISDLENWIKNPRLLFGGVITDQNRLFLMAKNRYQVPKQETYSLATVAKVAAQTYMLVAARKFGINIKKDSYFSTLAELSRQRGIDGKFFTGHLDSNYLTRIR